MFWPNLKLCNIPCLIEVTTLIDCCKTNTTSLYWNITYLLDTCLLGIKPSLKFQTIFIFHGSEKMCLHLSLYLYDGWWKVNTTCVDVLREAIQNINKNISNMFIEWYFKVLWPILIQMLKRTKFVKNIYMLKIFISSHFIALFIHLIPLFPSMLIRCAFVDVA